MLKIFQKSNIPKRYFTNVTHALLNETQFDLKNLDENKSQSVAHTRKKMQNEPFIKNIYAGSYIYNYLKYPEFENNHELADLTNILVEPIKRLNNKHTSKEAHALYDSLSLYSSAFPKKYGGLNLDQSTSIRISRLLEEYGANQSITFGVNFIYNNELAAKSISMYGTAEQKSKYLTKISNGTLKAAFCLKEPSNGCDVARFVTIANEEKDGSYLITGKKSWVTLLPKVGSELSDETDQSNVVLVVFCKTEDKLEKDVSVLNAFLVEKNAPGVSMKKMISSSRELDLYEIEFDNVKVNASSSLLGNSGAGLDIANKLIESAYHFVGAVCVGMLKTILRETVDFCINTKRFGKSLSEFPTIKERISELDSRIYAMESMVYLTAGTIDSFEIVDIGCESALTKIFCTESLKWGINQCMQIRATSALNNGDEETSLKKNADYADILLNLINTNDILRLHGKILTY